ncbi:HNH endonuclease [Streptosporangium sp. V21-05]|uniref:HNH endonuclease n=1 Tax=Streptosporangium sp. V21-05 TaxID=3446115 RepID=UPI003F5338B1
MSTKRPAIPRDLRRRVLIEAGHRCAIPTCRATPVEIAHIIPWAKARKHEFKNLIALCPNCHTRFDDPNNPLDRKAMRQYKANLNPLLFNFGGRSDQIALASSYQEFRANFAAWVFSTQALGAAKAKANSSAEKIAELRRESIERFADAMVSSISFKLVWENTKVPEIAGTIICHVADWSDEIFESPCPSFVELTERDISEELSEISSELHLSVCEEIGILDAEF